MKTTIYVNRAAIKRGEPPITVLSGKLRRAGFDVIIDGPSRVVFSPTKRRSPKVWIETHASVVVEERHPSP